MFFLRLELDNKVYKNVKFKKNVFKNIIMCFKCYLIITYLY